MTEEPTSSFPAPSSNDGGGLAAGTPANQSVSLDSGDFPANAPSTNTPTQQSQAAAPAGVTPDPNGTPAQQAAWDAMPRSWKKEMEAHWAKVDPDVRKYVHEREGQVYRGIQQYAKGYDSWSKLTQPFEQVLSQHPEVNPVELFGQLGNNHMLLTTGTQEQKVELARGLLAHYGIDPASLVGGQQAPAAGGQPAGGTEGFTPAQMRALQEMLNPVTQRVQTVFQTIEQQRLSEAESAVDKFFSNPDNKYAGEVGQDMLQLLQQGRASNLQEAYELAVMLNPTTKAKYIAELAQGQQSAGSAAPQLNVKSSTVPATPPAPASMDETMNEVLKKHYPGYKG